MYIIIISILYNMKIKKNKKRISRGEDSDDGNSEE